MLIDVILIAVAAVLVGVYVSWRAGRLDRLHARVDGARAALPRNGHVPVAERTPPPHITDHGVTS